MRLSLPGVVVAVSLAAFAPVLSAQQPEPGKISPPSAAGQTAGPENWSTEQLLTSTVHQAWVLSGRNEATFFEMVTQLAEMSARNRNLQLPETAATGQRVGAMIKVAAKRDTNQLLYAVVDAAVRKVGTPLPASSAPAQ